MKAASSRIRLRWLLLAPLAIWGTFEMLFPGPLPLALPGPHEVGTTTFVVSGEKSQEPLVVQVWYPAERGASGIRAPWYPDATLAPGFPFHRMAAKLGHAIIDAPAARGVDHKLSVILYEHSWTGHRAENTALVANLASRGFVIVAVDHPRQARQVTYPDGRIVKSELSESLDFSTEDGVSRFKLEAESALASRARNLDRVTQSLADGAVSQLAGRLAIDRLGVLGYSFGGTHALRRCALDPEYVAGVNMDGLFLDGRLPDGPFLFIDQEMPAWLLKSSLPDEDSGQAMIRQSESRIQNALKGPFSERLVLKGTTHESFCDRLLYCRFPQFARAGNRSPGKLHGLLCDRIATFFSRALDHSH